MITLGNVERKYFESREAITASTLEISFRDEPVKMKLDGHKLDAETLSKWLYGSSEEFLKDYIRTSEKIKNPLPEEVRLMEYWKEDLSKVFNETKIILIKKHPALSYLTGVQK